MAKYCPVACQNGDPHIDQAATKQQKECKDLHPRCPIWQSLGECDINRDMKIYCRQSCNLCNQGGIQINENELCADKEELYV